ncbi:MAG: Uma2 family endonuclease [Cyanobacteria bacterium J06597_16]
MTATIPKKTEYPVITWPLLPDDFVLPDDPVVHPLSADEAQPLIAAALTQALASLPELTKDALIVSDFALCAGINGRIICKAPDWMYVAPVEPADYIRRSYTPHTQGDVPPVVMEFLSESDCGEYSMKSMETDHKTGKWHFYERVIEVPRYVIFDPASARLEVYALSNNRYELETADEQGRYLIPGLNLLLGVWEGTHEIRTGPWLRWWTPEGEIVPWSEEKVEQAEAKAEQAKAKAEQAEVKAEQAEAKAEQAEVKAEQAEAKVEQAEAEVQQAKAEAERERKEKEALLEKLRAAGLE